MADEYSPKLVEQLTRLNSIDFIEAFDLPRLPMLDILMQLPIQFPARSISRIVAQYDNAIHQDGLQAASQWLVSEVVQRTMIYKSENIPQTGPLLLVSNHPGMVDAMAIFASIARKDLLIIAKDRPILRLLQHVSEHLIFAPDSDNARIATIRKTTQHLRAGNSLLLFPAGKIEPDPALHLNSAIKELNTWSRSIALFARAVPNLTILPVAVSGVISARALRNPITSLYGSQERRDWVAATLMVIYESNRNVTVKVRYGSPIKITSNEDVKTLSSEVHQQMESLYHQM